MTTILNKISEERLKEINEESMVKKVYKTRRKIKDCAKVTEKATLCFGRETLEERAAFAATEGVKNLFSNSLRESLQVFIEQLKKTNVDYQPNEITLELTPMGINEFAKHLIPVEAIANSFGFKKVNIKSTERAHTWEPISEKDKRFFIKLNKTPTALSFAWRIPELKRSYAYGIQSLSWIEARNSKAL